MDSRTVNVIITANGKGERMKCLSSRDKHTLFYKEKRIVTSLVNKMANQFGGANVIGGFPSNSRKETLATIKDMTNVLIVDCDIIIPDRLQGLDTSQDCIYYFISDKEKYSSLNIENGILIEAKETINISSLKSSGVYFIKSMARLLERMGDNSIAEGMTGAKCIFENYILKLGDPQDYYEALKIKGGSFTGNKITFNDNTIIKHCKTGLSEANWYDMAQMFATPAVMFADSEMIITERIYNTCLPDAEDFIRIIKMLKEYDGNKAEFQTYIDNIIWHSECSSKCKWVQPIEHEATFFHGDLSTKNVLKNTRLYLIDPNYKNVFGSWLTDAGKAVFSFISYEQDFNSAKKIVDYFGKDVWTFAVLEGLRVCKYRPEYISIVNNIAEFT